MLVIADERTDILEIFTPLASALAAGNAQAFLGDFDRNMPGYDDLSNWVVALVDEYEITSSVDFLESKGEDIQLEWSMRLRSRIPGAKSDDRKQVLAVRVSRKKKVVSLQPLTFFKP